MDSYQIANMLHIIINASYEASWNKKYQFKKLLEFHRKALGVTKTELEALKKMTIQQIIDQSNTNEKIQNNLNGPIRNKQNSNGAKSKSSRNAGKSPRKKAAKKHKG